MVVPSDTLSVDRELSTERSRRLFEEARRYSPMGVHGVMKYYPPWPLFIDRARGSRFWDVDGNEFLDFYAGGGPAILGHSHPEINSTVNDVIQNVGTCYCAPHPRELDLAKLLVEIVPSAEKTGFGVGGSDACLYAVR